MARLNPPSHLHHPLHLDEQFLPRLVPFARIGQPRSFVAVTQQVVGHQFLVDLGELLLREAELLGRHVSHRFQLLAELGQAGIQFGMAEAMPLTPRQVEQVGDLLGVDAKHRRVLHPVGPGHHAEHPFRRRHGADRQVGRGTLRCLRRFGHLHARAVAEQLERVAGHGVERLDAALVQHGQRCRGTPVMAPRACRPLIGGHQAEQAHDSQREQRKDQISCRCRRATFHAAGRRHPIAGPTDRPPLVAARLRLVVVLGLGPGPAAVVAIGKPEERAAEVGEHAPEGEHAGDVGDQPAGILHDLEAGHLAALTVGEIHLGILALVEGLAAVSHRVVHPDAAILLCLRGDVGERHVGGEVARRFAGAVVDPPHVGEGDGVGLVLPAIPQLQPV